jgi:Patatin-like phospholipase
MPTTQKTKRRGFVMTGGGAKGLYEAGVVHAFHLTGIEFDAVTGSSIGAFNSVFFAEYLLRKRQLPPDVQADPVRSVDAMDALVKAYHHAWLRLPNKQIVDDSDTGPIGRLKDDLSRFDVRLPDLVHLAWWWTDPDRGSIPSPKVWPALVRLGRELVERLGGAGKLLDIIKHHREAPFQRAVRTYLANFGLEHSLVPPQDDGRLASVFTDPITPLRLEDLGGQEAAPGVEPITLVPSGRTLRDYAQAGIDVRLTRANYRTGRLELSAYVPAAQFAQWLQKHAFRLEKADPDKIPLGSLRLQVPGNPTAISAAFASGRFPGVFVPFPIESIYPAADPDNALLYKLLAGWLADPQVKSQVAAQYQAVHPGRAQEDDWAQIYDKWQKSEGMRRFFPQAHDVYVDGGAIDNTPSNSAIDATREWLEQAELSRQDVVLDLYTIFLHAEPGVDPADIQDPALHQVMQRTLEIQGAAKQSSAAVVVDTINTFGQRGEKLADSLLAVLGSYQEALRSLDDAQRRALLDRLRDEVARRGVAGYRGPSSDGILDRMEAWAQEILSDQLPLQVRAVKIYPEEMPLSTLQLTGRLGYRQDNALAMLTMGCYNTLWTIRSRLEAPQDPLDDQDRRALALAQKWMGIDAWPADAAGQEALRQTWRCQRTACVFHSTHCPHGASLPR